MLKRTEKELQEMEDGYPGVIESIMELEEMSCPVEACNPVYCSPCATR
ncbi:MAG: hypothetical protein QF541_07625 [Lentisphaeria bacterium]|jgi:hypothetical protein|nr:hypothetical protein [Lentisphaeria bacterium]